MDSPATTAAETVAAVLLAHVASFDEAGQAYQRAWSDHAATAVIEALGLSREWAVLYDGESIPDGDVTDDRAHAEALAAERCRSCDTCRGALPKHVVARLVGPWRLEQK